MNDKAGIQEFKRLFKQFYFDEMSDMEVLELAMLIDDLLSLLHAICRNDEHRLQELDRQLNEFGDELRAMAG